MMMMRRYVVFAGSMLVAGRANRIVRLFQLQRMWVVAIGTADVFMIHLALNKRPIHIDFVFDLPVNVVGRWLQELQRVMIGVCITRAKISTQHAPAAVARCARLQLRLGIVAFQLGKSIPVDAVLKYRPTLGKFDVQAAGAVTRFAADVNF